MYLNPARYDQEPAYVCNDWQTNLQQTKPVNVKPGRSDHSMALVGGGILYQA